MLLLAALAVLLVASPRDVVAQQLCSVEFSLPAGAYAELAPGESVMFSYSAEVTAYDMREINVEVLTGPSSGLIVSVRPSFTNVTGIQPDVAQIYPVFGGITVTVPESLPAGTYSVSGVGAIATCTTTDQNNNTVTQVSRSPAQHLTIDVLRPLPTPTMLPEPTSTPVPPPAVCMPGFSLASSSFDAEPGERISVPFEATVAVRRVSEVILTLVSEHQGGIAVSFDPGGQTFGFDPLPAETVFRTFSGTIQLDTPADQQPGTYGVNGLYLQADCQGVDTTGSPTAFQTRSDAQRISVRLTAPTATPEPTSTNTPVPSPTATVTATATATARPSATPTATPGNNATATARATATATPTARPTSTADPAATPTRTTTATATVDPTATPRSIVRPSGITPVPTMTIPGASPTATEDGGTTASPVEPADTPRPDEPGDEQMASTSLSWQESRAMFAAEESETGWGKPLAAILAAILIAAGSAGVWHTRYRSGV